MIDKKSKLGIFTDFSNIYINIKNIYDNLKKSQIISIYQLKLLFSNHLLVNISYYKNYGLKTIKHN